VKKQVIAVPCCDKLQKGVPYMTKRWQWCISAALFSGIFLSVAYYIIPRWLDLRQREKVAWAFAKALEQQDFKEAVKWIMKTEQDLGVNPQVIASAFEVLKLPRMNLIGVKSVGRIDFQADVRSFWTVEGGKKPVRVMLILQKEGKEWRINFFFTFRRFCWLRLYLNGMDPIEAFYRAEREAGRILGQLGVKGYVSPVGTVREMGAVRGWITPEGWKEKKE